MAIARISASGSFPAVSVLFLDKVDKKSTRLSNRSGLAEKGYHFHDLRRTFATMLYNRGVHLTKIQRLLGHKSVATTERYLGVKFEETAQAILVLDSPALKALAAPILSTNCAQPSISVIEPIQYNIVSRET